MLRHLRSLPTFLLAGLLPAVAGCAPRAAEDPAATGDEPAAAGTAVEATSLLGVALLRPELEAAFRDEQTRLLARAESALADQPDDAGALIWVGRRQAYLGRYREAIDTFTRGIEEHPDDARLYRHRGHRYVTVRELDKAVADLERAAELIEGREPEVEPDGLPNARNQPTGTTHTSVWYHLGLAHYLKGDFEQALAAYRECLDYSANPDMVVAATHWLYMTLRRLGQDAEAARLLAPISAGMDVIENFEYHELLLMYRGEKAAAELLAEGEGVAGATIAYGVGNWYFYTGERERALEIFRAVLDADAWAAFGYLAAEAELARSTRSP
jgi:tetratricopeptide (TPR) repeat protein